MVRLYPPCAAPHLYVEHRGGNASLNQFSPVDAEAGFIQNMHSNRTWSSIAFRVSACTDERTRMAEADRPPVHRMSICPPQ